MKDSSGLELRTAFENLAKYGNDAVRAYLGNASLQAETMGRYFQGVNSSLSESWYTVEDFCMKISESVARNVEQFYHALDRFCNETYTIEGEAAKAAETANTQADSILKELGL